jgi:hypothetical protein
MQKPTGFWDHRSLRWSFSFGRGSAQFQDLLRGGGKAFGAKSLPDNPPVTPEVAGLSPVSRAIISVTWRPFPASLAPSLPWRQVFPSAKSSVAPRRSHNAGHGWGVRCRNPGVCPEWRGRHRRSMIEVGPAGRIVGQPAARPSARRRCRHACMSAASATNEHRTFTLAGTTAPNLSSLFRVFTSMHEINRTSLR